MKEPVLNDNRTVSDTLYVRGLSKRITDEELTSQILNVIESPVEVDLHSKRSSGMIWARYSSIAVAQRTMIIIHQNIWHGVSLNVKFEMGYDEYGKRIVSKNSHNTVIRSISFRKGHTPARAEAQSRKTTKKAHQSASYTSKSILLGNFEYPFPTGLYFSRIIQLMRTKPLPDPLLSMLTDPSLGNKYGKEISEVMAMVDATDRAVKLVVGDEPSTLSTVTVYVVGDGKRPLTAAGLCLNMPTSWKYVSIDPLLEVSKVNLGEYSDRFHLHNSYSQNFDLSHTCCTESTEINDKSNSLAIVAALHSHAPLAEFWTRLGGRKIAVTMACCAEYSDLSGVGEFPVLEFDDFEVYSPKRTIRIYASNSCSIDTNKNISQSLNTNEELKQPIKRFKCSTDSIDEIRKSNQQQS